MYKLTGNKDIDIFLLTKISDKDLLSVSRVNKYVYTLFEKEILWRKRLLNAFPLKTDEIFEFDFLTLKIFYKFLRLKCVGKTSTHEKDYRYAANRYFYLAYFIFLKRFHFVEPPLPKYYSSII